MVVDGLLTRFEERRPFLARFLPPLARSSPCRSSHPFARLRLKCATLASAMAVKGTELGTAGSEGRVRARVLNVDTKRHLFIPSSLQFFELLLGRNKRARLAGQHHTKELQCTRQYEETRRRDQTRPDGGKLRSTTVNYDTLHSCISTSGPAIYVALLAAARSL